MSDATRSILVLGATGHTGRLVAVELARRGLPLVLAGRSRERLAEVADQLDHPAEIRLASPSEPASLDGLFADVAAVVNTVGPFTELGEPVLRAALEQGAHYLDSTGEAPWMRRMIERYHGLFRARRRVALCAQAFEYALGHCAAAIALAELNARAELLEVFYRVDRPRVSKGTARSMVGSVARPVIAWVDGRLVTEPYAARSASFTFPGDEHPSHGVSFGAGEPLHANRYGEAREVRSYLVVNAFGMRAARLISRLAPTLRRPLVRRVLRELAGRLVPRLPRPEAGPPRFLVAARAVGAGRERRVVVAGPDPYDVSAVLAAEAAARLLDLPAQRLERCAGVVSLPEVFDPRDFLDALEPAGVTWEVGDRS